MFSIDMIKKVMPEIVLHIISDEIPSSPIWLYKIRCWFIFPHELFTAGQKKFNTLFIPYECAEIFHSILLWRQIYFHC